MLKLLTRCSWDRYFFWLIVSGILTQDARQLKKYRLGGPLLLSSKVVTFVQGSLPHLLHVSEQGLLGVLPHRLDSCAGGVGAGEFQGI